MIYVICFLLSLNLYQWIVGVDIKLENQYWTTTYKQKGYKLLNRKQLIQHYENKLCKKNKQRALMQFLIDELKSKIEEQQSEISSHKHSIAVLIGMVQKHETKSNPEELHRYLEDEP